MARSILAGWTWFVILLRWSESCCPFFFPICWFFLLRKLANSRGFDKCDFHYSSEMAAVERELSAEDVGRSSWPVCFSSCFRLTILSICSTMSTTIRMDWFRSMSSSKFLSKRKSTSTLIRFTAFSMWLTQIKRSPMILRWLNTFSAFDPRILVLKRRPRHIPLV